MRIALCDDEKACRDTLIQYLEQYKIKFPTLDVFEFCSGEELIASYESGYKYDILFLDIQMKKTDGVDTAKFIRNRDEKAIIIFITGYFYFVSETFRVGAFQFLMKPLRAEDFKKDFERAIKHYQLIHNKYAVKYKEQEAIFEIGDIYYIESYQRHLFLYTEHDKFEFIGKLSDEEKRLTMFRFIRCHQGYLVNMEYIKFVSKDYIILKNNAKIPVSKYLRLKVKDAFNDYLAGCSI